MLSSIVQRLWKTLTRSEQRRRRVSLYEFEEYKRIEHITDADVFPSALPFKKNRNGRL